VCKMGTISSVCVCIADKESDSCGTTGLGERHRGDVVSVCGVCSRDRSVHVCVLCFVVFVCLDL